MPKPLTNALIIFAKRPVPGLVKTRLIPCLTPDEAAELYCCMLEDILAWAARLAAVDKYLFYEGDDEAGRFFRGIARGMTCLPQQGADLGERMSGAFRRVFAEGYGAAAIIGTDSPDLPVSSIVEAYELLTEGDTSVVFGPSEDGGYYLLGMTAMHEGLFRDIPWSSGDVLRESLRRAEEAGISVSFLPPWHDVDRAEDLTRSELLDENNDAPLTREFIKTRLGAQGSRL